MASRDQRVICLGNGNSRKGLDLDKLSLYFTMYGCNAIYRDWTPDVLVAVDHGIMHEIYHSGFGYSTPCYFRDWTKLPGHAHDNLIYSGLTKDELDKAKEWDVVRVNKKTTEEEFVMHGAQIKGIINVLTRTKGEKHIKEKKVNHASLCVSWTRSDDKVKDLKELMCKPDGISHDYGWSAGPTSGFIAVKREKPKEIYMVGHDLYSGTSKVNNLYAGTQYYVHEEHSPTPCVNWIRQWRELMTWNPDIMFYKVNEFNDGRDKMNTPIEEWNEVKNLKYIDRNALDRLCQM